MKDKNIFLTTIVLFLICLCSCDSDSEAQQVNNKLTATFSGSFITASVNTDTNDDGRPSFTRTYEGESNLGNLTISIVDEFAQPVPPLNSPDDNLEFNLVSGSFVIRTESGDLILGEINSGFSCFEPIERVSQIIEIGAITGGTGEFANVNGSVELNINSTFLNTTSVNGFASGGSTGSMEGTID